MSEFNVSFDMALNRLENLEKISREERLRLDNDKNQTRVGNLLKSVGGNSKLNEVSNSIEIPYEYIQYVIYNYNRNAIPKKTLERVLQYYKLTIADVSDKLVNHDEDISDLDDLIGGLTD